MALLIKRFLTNGILIDAEELAAATGQTIDPANILASVLERFMATDWDFAKVAEARPNS
jgi:hypothetical protein